jgi:DNA primase large subunit
LIEKKLQGFDGSMDAFIDEQSLNIITSIPSNFRESADEDVASHFILRLGLSKSQDFIDWFIKNEEALFLCKLRQTGSEGLSRIMRESPELSHLARDVISRQINSNEFEEIRRSTPAPGDQATLFYKIRFTEIPAHLISRRSVVVIGGIAYVPDKEMITLIGRKYRDHLMGAMMVAARERGRMINEDERIKIIADRMSPAALLTSNKISSLSPTEKLSLSNFNILLGRSIPPCMRVAIESMRPSEGSRSGGRHLKNTGRNQLAPFLRTAGMSLDESLQWWRTEFTRGSQMDSDKFDKNYTYNIKWVYGKAGRMKEAAPMSCSTIINLEYPSHDQTHGCPFKVFDESRITNLLKGWLTKAGVPLDTNEGRIKEIARKATGQSHEYQLACVDWFTLMHEGHSGDGIGNHPNSYFSESVAYWADRDGTTDESGVSTKMNVDSRGDSEVSVSQAHAG